MTRIEYVVLLFMCGTIIAVASLTIYAAFTTLGGKTLCEACGKTIDPADP